MKYLFLLILPVLLLTQTSAQTSSASSPLEVLEKKWKHNPSGISSGMLDTDPFQPANETRQLLQDRKQTVQDNRVRKEQGLPQEPLPTRAKNSVVKNPATMTAEFSADYSYQIKVRNNGSKLIRSITWEYVFLDPTTKQEAGRHKFTSETHLEQGETDKLTAKRTAPIRIVNAKSVGNGSSEPYIEQIIIKSIQYDDGSVWQSDTK